MQPNIHDALFKSTFSQAEHAALAIKRMLPAALAALIDFESLALCSGSFVDEALKERHSDVLFSTKLGDRLALVYLLWEHQSRADPLMPFRLLRYMILIWEAFLRDNPDAKKLPVIIPLVIHHSETGWTVAQSFEELLDVDPEALAALGEHAVRLRFVLDDISAESSESLRSRAMSALGKLSLYCLRYARTPEDLVRGLSDWADLLREVRRAPSGAAALAMVLRYIFVVSDRYEPEEFVALLVQVVGEEAKEELMTVADKLREEGRKVGHDEGRKEGRREGVQEGQRRTLLKLLAARFGALPEAAVARVSAAAQAELDQWAERLFSAPTLADLLGDA